MCVVADIVDKQLLREYLLLCDPLGPVDNIQLEERMTFSGVFITLRMVKPSVVRHVTEAENVGFLL